MKHSNFNSGLFIILILLLPFSSAAAATDSSYVNVFYSTFISGDMPKWEKNIQTLETSNNIKTIEQKLELINYYYGYIGYLIGQKKYTQTKELTERGEKLIEEVLRQSPKNATAYSFRGIFQAYNIVLYKYKIIWLAYQCKWNVNKALELDPQNIQALIDEGNILFYAPKFYGGDKKKALSYYLKAAEILEKKRDISQNWIYINLLSVIAEAYEKTDNLQEAKLTYEKILRIEPNVTWVKNKMYPKLLEKMKS